MSRTPKRLLMSGLALVAVGAIAVAYLASREAKRLYERESIRRLEPPGLVLLHPESSAERTPLDALLLGDSRIAELPFDSELEVRKAGYPGATTGELRLHSAELERSVSPRLVVIQAGVNDLKAIGAGADSTETIDRVCENLMAIAARWHERCDAGVVICAILPTGRPSPGRRLVWSDQIAPAVESANERLAASGEAWISFLPLDEFLDRERGRAKTSLYRDTLHLNARGNAIFIDAIRGSEAFAQLEMAR